MKTILIVAFATVGMLWPAPNSVSCFETATAISGNTIVVEDITILLTDSGNSSEVIQLVEVYDGSNTLVLSSTGNGTSRLETDLSSLGNGTYDVDVSTNFGGFSGSVTLSR